MTATSQLTIRGLTVDYGGAGGVRALEDLDLAVEAGSFHALLGPSGCGKSTLIKVLAGLVSRSAGEFNLPGDGSVAYVPQGNSCFPWLRAEENVAYGLRLQGVAKRERIDRSTNALLRTLGLEQFARAFPAQLSEGMRQRVAIARAFAVESPVLLMDEPLSALDFQTKASVQSELMQLWAERRCTVLYVTHDIDEALTLADRISVLSARPGRIALAEDVPFARPRNHATLREQPGYGALFRKLYEALET